jgi:glutamate racemase|tara:strand:- start:23262 stop:24095 length:834 start_codon:yes stop_codon:yes gene_type:complete
MKNINQKGDSRPIGILDSGVGGLSIAKAIAERLPNENLIYIADTLHNPYGNKSLDFIQTRTNDISKFLFSQSAKALVIACNTATVNAIDQIRANINIPIIGVEPAIKPAAKQSITKNVGILVTQATAENYRFQYLIEQHKNDAQVHIQACPGLVELIETNKMQTRECELLLTQFLTSLLSKNVDTLVLGCTHYPFLTNKIRDIVGTAVNIIETAIPVTLQLRRKLTEQNLLNLSKEQGNYRFLSSKVNRQQQQLFIDLWQQPLELKSFLIPQDCLLG